MAGTIYSSGLLAGKRILITGGGTGQRLAGPGTFAGLTSLSSQDWADIRERSKAASAAAKAQRTS
jgi:hypothetical protein